MKPALKAGFFCSIKKLTNLKIGTKIDNLIKSFTLTLLYELNQLNYETDYYYSNRSYFNTGKL